MSDNSAPELWQLRLIGTRVALDLAELEIQSSAQNEPLSFSLFEDELPLWRLEVVFDAPVHTKWVAQICQKFDLTNSVERLADVNWVLESLKDLSHVQAGRFFIHGTHEAPTNDPNLVNLCIPAGMAFGTGHHGTTSGCLMAYDRLLQSNHSFSNILDLGTGTGLLAIAAAKTQAGKILATDIDPVAVAVASENAALNNVQDKIEFATVDGLCHPAMGPARFDLIFANILTGPLIELSADVEKCLAPSGQLILAGLLTDHTSRVLNAYQKLGLQLVHSQEFDEWTILQFEKPAKL